ncbi:GNAT family N-acetyltransferase [Caldalkalibacillus mannanilyticus]|uniref:GNAT family N-acetyltransferase n=1 Tax=Caldalkalibacillus mannanilyticus TaxID=1418 RepID=UPI0004682E0C|nr:GNAT family N-acetyltransferase [Caldalkalibacillus mannanilyticus]
MVAQLTQIRDNQKERFLNLYNLYLYDLSGFLGDDPRSDGKFDANHAYVYIEKKELYPFFIEAENKVVGFILVCAHPYVPEGVDYTIQELFVLKKYRGRNIATQAVKLVFDQFQGRYKVEQLKINKLATTFWDKVYKDLTIETTRGEESIEIEGISGTHKLVSQIFDIPSSQ